jgi:FkbM family methyltransferase
MSQYNENEILNKFFGDKKDGVVVEIGAAFYDINSNSKMLIEKGWKALLVEPNTKFYKELQEFHKENTNVFLENCCAYENDIEEVEFFEYDQCSTMDVNFKKRVEDIGQSNEDWVDFNGEVKNGFIRSTKKAVKTDKIIKKYFEKVDFLSVDCEGSDYQVLKGINFDDIYINLICYERQNDEDINIQIENLLTHNGFELYEKNIGNYFYVNKNNNNL